MDNNDWVRLWLINRTIAMECNVAMLLYNVTKEHCGYWSFPDQPAIQAGVDSRTKHLQDCIREGLIDIYPRSWMKSCQFVQSAPLDVSQCHLCNQQTANDFQAIATLKGHQLWEAMFQPDWQRYWQAEMEPVSHGEAFPLSTTYASDEMFQELVNYLPDYFQLDREFGLRQAHCNTVFQYQATKWKVLPCMKIVVWNVKNDDVLGRAIHSATADASGGDKREVQRKIGQQFRTEKEGQRKAIQLLTRLSGRWDCVTEGSDGQSGRVPVLRPGQT